jgi:hypothetical protein
MKRDSLETAKLRKQLNETKKQLAAEKKMRARADWMQAYKPKQRITTRKTAHEILESAVYLERLINSLKK